jgi:two-component system, cell cycle sensor histidine kinase and response regulator CckA
MQDADLQASIDRFGRLYVASSQVSRAVVRSQSPQQLLEEVVRILVVVGRFAMAFIARHDPETRELVAVAQYGEGEGYAQRIRLATDGGPEAQGPGGTAFRTGIPYICPDFFADPRTIPWRQAARAYDWRASAAFPIQMAGRTWGLLSVYARETGVFDADRVELLQQVVHDVAFGLEHLDTEEQRARAEAALASSERRLKSALDAAGMGTFEWDLATGTVTWDGHTETIFGLQPGEFDNTYEGFERLLHPDDRLPLRLAGAKAAQAHTPFGVEFRVVRPDGSERWVSSHSEYRYSDTGHALSLHGTVTDITRGKRAELALLESEERLRQAVRAAQIGIFDHLHADGSLYWSPQFFAIHGWPASQAATLEAYMERIHPGDRERVAASMRNSRDPAGDGLYDIEHRLLFPDGSTRWTSTRAQTLFEGQGPARRAVRTVGAVRDVTLQKLAEEEQHKLATVVANSRGFIGIATPDGRVVYVNRAGLDMVGLASPEAARQTTVADYFPTENQDFVQDVLLRSLRETGYWSGETRLRHFQTGQLIDVDITAFQINDEPGNPLFFATHTRDITDRKRAEAEKQALEEQLFQARKMESIGRLAGGVAHDFNNLLTVINGYSQLALTQLERGHPLYTAVGEIQAAGERAAGMTRQLLAFSRKQVLKPRSLDLNRVVEDMKLLLERLVGDHVEVSFGLHASPAVVNADPHQLEQVVLNLAANARDAMPRGGRLRIETGWVERDDTYLRLHPTVQAGRYVTLVFSDTGTGMGKETQQRIFDPFFTTKPEGRGTGLGLSTVQGVVTQCGGHIEVHSEPGRGATFTICLPARPDQAPINEVKAPDANLRGTETILVVDDKPAVREFTVAALESYGYRTLAAGSGAQALDLAQRGTTPIHLVLTDVVMPQMGGVELARRVAETRPRTRVLFMSGYSGNISPNREGFDPELHFIAKPFTPEGLAAKVRRVLELEPPGLGRPPQA